MPVRELDPDELQRLLPTQEVVRIAFRSTDGIYLIPLGYVILSGHLAGLTERGLKLELAAANSKVAFQVDSAAHTGPFEWWSITGEGIFRVVTETAPVERVMQAMKASMEQAPDWWQVEQDKKIKRGELVVWRIQTTWMTGRRYAAPLR